MRSSDRKKLVFTYAGIGSSKLAPPEVLSFTTDFAYRLRMDDVYDFYLRSGGAAGMDEAFHKGAGSKSFIFLPRQGHNGIHSKYHDPLPEAYAIAERYHPNWRRLSPFVRSLMARNAHIILGYRLNRPCRFVVCWTQDGCEHVSERTPRTGGTGHSIAIASDYGIPIFNLQRRGLDFESLFFEIQAQAGLIPF